VSLTPLVSICIPAYANQYFLDRLVKSIKGQTYRPLELVIVDDNSPTPLTAQNELEETNLQIRLLRNAESYGPYWNMLHSISLARGEYIYQIDHDDYLVDSNFIENAVGLFENIPELQLVIANSELENSERTTLPRTHESGFRYFEGISFLRNHLFDEIHPARSGYIMNYKTLVKAKFEDVFFPQHYFDSQSIYPDESFSLPVILCSFGDVIVSSEIVSVRGNPPNSFSKTDFWQKNSNVSVLIQHCRLTQFLFTNKKYVAGLIMLRACLYGSKHSPKISLRNLSILKNRKIAKSSKLIMVINFLAHFPGYFLRRVFYSLRFRILGH